MCLHFKALKIVFTFCTNICDSINNYIKHDKNQPHKEVGDVYIL